MAKKTTDKCSICGGSIAATSQWHGGNNAWPVNDGRCCDICNTFRVIPARQEMTVRETQKENT